MHVGVYVYVYVCVCVCVCVCVLSFCDLADFVYDVYQLSCNVCCIVYMPG